MCMLLLLLYYNSIPCSRYTRLPGYPIVAVPTRQTVVWTVVGRTHVQASVLFPFHALCATFHQRTARVARRSRSRRRQHDVTRSTSRANVTPLPAAGHGVCYTLYARTAHSDASPLSPRPTAGAPPVACAAGGPGGPWACTPISNHPRTGAVQPRGPR